MADTVSSEKRSEIMRKVKGSNTTPELELRKELWKTGVRGYRVHSKNLLGRPDIAYTKAKLAIFIDGCFWHGCPKCYRRPNSRQDYWDAKLAKNIKRDRCNEEALCKCGWTVLRFWEHEIHHNVTACVSTVTKALNESDGPSITKP